MGVVSRIAYKLPSVKALQEIAAQREDLARQIDQVSSQRDELRAERDELAAHCDRLVRQAAETRDRERRFVEERTQLLSDRDALERERDELLGHCRRLELDLAGRGEPEKDLRRQLDSLNQLHRDFVEQAMRLIGNDALAAQMQRDWDERARSNALHFTNSERTDWNEAEYDATGERNIREHIANDMENICQGADPAAMRVVEIGCGAGRMTKALARVFAEVHAVDISAEMLRIARQRLAGVSNVVFHHNNGMDLRDLPSEQCDFALSFIVFQHIPSKAVIESYIREVCRVLKPGRLFKFQVQGGAIENAPPLSTWLGAAYTRAEMEGLAVRHGFELRYAHGEGTQDFWLWFFKKQTGS
jgi:SAM-dependent methyltransferase